MDQERSSFIDRWRDIAKFTMPKLPRFYVTGNESRGQKDTRQIVDLTGTLALRTCVSGFMAHITNPSRQWFKLQKMVPSLEEMHDLDEWTDSSTEIINDVMIRSNQYTELRKLFTSYINFGTAAMIILEDDEDVMRCETFSIGTYWIGTNHKRKVDEFLRNPVMTVRQLVDKFGLEKVSEATKTAYKNKQFQNKVEVLHWIGPNKMYNAGRLESKFKKFREIYIESGAVGSPGNFGKYYPGGNSGNILLESGYDEFPVVAPRWDCDGEDSYGVNYPGDMALPLIKRLQQEVKAKAKGIEKQVDPPLNVPEHARRNTIVQDPKGLNFVDMRTGSDGIKPMYQVNFDISGISQDIAELQKMIRMTYYEHLFMMLANERRSGTKAAEIQMLEDEKFSAIGPVLQQLNDELLDPLVNRVFNICLKKGLLPPPPADAQGQDIKVDYISPMAQAQKMVGIQGQDRVRAMVGEVAQFNPEAADLWDWDDDIRVYAKRVGIDATLIKSSDEVAQIRQQRAEAQAQRQQLAVQQTQANIAETLSKAKTSEDNALTQLMNQQRVAP
jgi:hypothetical protein